MRATNAGSSASFVADRIGGVCTVTDSLSALGLVMPLAAVSTLVLAACIAVDKVPFFGPDGSLTNAVAAARYAWVNGATSAFDAADAASAVFTAASRVST